MRSRSRLIVVDYGDRIVKANIADSSIAAVEVLRLVATVSVQLMQVAAMLAEVRIKETVLDA